LRYSIEILAFFHVDALFGRVMPRVKILVGWTTVDSAPAAKKIATGLIAARLAACVQVDGPIVSHYVWQGKQSTSKEWRLWIKFPSTQSHAIEKWLRAHHPYSTPQWLAVEVAEVAKPYQKWLLENSGGMTKPKKR
jgi:periplasmic divalent cation tolerance protein